MLKKRVTLNPVLSVEERMRLASLRGPFANVCSIEGVTASQLDKARRLVNAALFSHYDPDAATARDFRPDIPVFSGKYAEYSIGGNLFVCLHPGLCFIERIENGVRKVLWSSELQH